MINVLIICKNAENAKKLLNNVISKIDSLRLIGIACSFDEAISLLNSAEINLIISTSHKAIGFLKCRFLTYSPSIIIIDNIIRLIDNYPKSLLISNKYSFDVITNKIMLFLKNNIEQNKKEKISRILMELGFSFKWAGTLYLQDSIFYVNSYKGSYSFEKIKRDVYTYVASCNNTTSDRVKWSIERAIKYMMKKQNEASYKNIEKLLRIEYPTMPKSKQLISAIANKLDTLY